MLGSISMDKSKARLLYGRDDPKDAMIKEATSGLDDESSWRGMSLCV